MQEFRTIEMLNKLLDVGALRHKVIAHNIANVNTPGFKKSEIQFEDEFQRVLARGDLERAKRLRPRMVQSNAAPLRNDGNNVDIDREIGHLSKNALLYKTYAALLGRKLSMMKSAVTGQNH